MCHPTKKTPEAQPCKLYSGMEFFTAQQQANSQAKHCRSSSCSIKWHLHLHSYHIAQYLISEWMKEIFAPREPRLISMCRISHWTSREGSCPFDYLSPITNCMSRHGQPQGHAVFSFFFFFHQGPLSHLYIEGLPAQLHQPSLLWSKCYWSNAELIKVITKNLIKLSSVYFTNEELAVEMFRSLR